MKGAIWVFIPDIWRIPYANVILGVASGAALLRMTDSRSTEEVDTYGPDQQQDAADFYRPPVSFALTSLSQLDPFLDPLLPPFYYSFSPELFGFEEMYTESCLALCS